MPNRSAPAVTLYVGSLYEDLIRNWCVGTCTIVVRRREAGDALRFPEDIRLYEDVECWARLARRGAAGYLDCETAWQHFHPTPRLSNADALTCADAALTVIARVWGLDEAYLECHEDEFHDIVNLHRSRKARALLGMGRTEEAQRELAECRRVSLGLRILMSRPAAPLRLAIVTRRRVRGLWWSIQYAWRRRRRPADCRP